MQQKRNYRKYVRERQNMEIYFFHYVLLVIEWTMRK